MQSQDALGELVGAGPFVLNIEVEEALGEAVECEIGSESASITLQASGILTLTDEAEQSLRFCLRYVGRQRAVPTNRSSLRCLSISCLQQISRRSAC